MNGSSASRVPTAFRVLVGFLSAVRVLLAWRYLQLGALQIVAPVDDPFFPLALRHPGVLLAAFFVPLLPEWQSLASPTRRRMKAAALTEFLSATVLLLHQTSYFYATWVVIFWVSAYLVWMAWSATGDDYRASAEGPFLAQLVIAYLFLGGAVGKWTAGYWSGTVLNELLFTSHASFGFLLTTLGGTPETTAVWLSRAMIVGETALAGVVFLPARPACVVSAVAAIALWANSLDLFETSWPMLGLALAGGLLAGGSGPKEAGHEPAATIHPPD